MPKNSKEPKDKGKTAGQGKAQPKAVGASGPAKLTGVTNTDASTLHIAAQGQNGAAPSTDTPKRKLGLRGAAPWAARHAAKHAAEARARAAQPPPPGSARATIRVPTGAEELKAKIGDLHNALLQIRAHRKNLAKGFYEIGLVLRDIQQRRLYEAKGYGSFEAFLEREIDLGKTMALRLIRISATFVRDAALEHGLERLSAALAPLEHVDGARPGPVSVASVPLASRIALPLKPPLGRVG